MSPVSPLLILSGLCPRRCLQRPFSFFPFSFLDSFPGDDDEEEEDDDDVDGLGFSEGGLLDAFSSSLWLSTSSSGWG